MVTKREYLVSKGMAQPGRGRYSNIAKEELKRAINKGVKFDEVENNSSGVDATAEPRFDRPEGMYSFVNPDGRKFDLLHTTACVKCGYSFRWDKCVSGPFVWEYLSGADNYAELVKVPKPPRAAIIAPAKPARRGRKATTKG